MNDNQPYIPSELGELIFLLGCSFMEAEIFNARLNNLKNHKDNYELILEEEQS